MTKQNLYRILDANFNRLREGLRVCEDVCRFLIGSVPLSSELKQMRHEATRLFHKFPLEKLLENRDSEDDPGRHPRIPEKGRAGWFDIYFANIERAKESARVLEETSKYLCPKLAPRFKELRYRIYDHEKRCLKKVKALRHP